MNRLTTVALIAAIAVLGVLAQRASIDEVPEPGSVQAKPTERLGGTVVSIEPAKAPNAPHHALVRLDSGEAVRATIPNGCLVLPGQATRLVRKGEGSNRVYIVAENGTPR